MNKKVVFIAISVVIIVGIIGLTTDGFVRKNSTKIFPLISENNSKTPLISENNSKTPLISENNSKTPSPSSATRHNIEVNLNESMRFSAH